MLNEFLNTGFLEHTLANEAGSSAQSTVLANGTHLELWDTGILRCYPAENKSAYRVLISCGVHGNETAPMEIVDQLVSDILSEKITIKNQLLFVLGNPAAANRAKRFIDENLNRLFSGAHQQQPETLEGKRAAEIEKYVQRYFSEGDEAKVHYDLHTAIRGSKFEKFAVYPYREDQAWSKTQIGFLEKSGLSAILLSNKPSTTFSYFTAENFAADAFTVELGSVAKFGDNDMSRFTDVIASLTGLISGAEHFSDQPEKIQVFAVIEEVIKRSEAFKLHIPDDAYNFTAYPAGTVLASDQDYEYKTKVDGERFVFPIKNVPSGSRAMLVIAPTEL